MQQKRIYCLVPIELAGQLHDSLRRHFRDRPAVEVIVERRRRERRSGTERREADAGLAEAEERRRIRSASGRRVAERRAPLVALSGAEAPELPRRARRFASQLTFVERVEPATEAAEDADTARLVTRIQAGERDLFAELYLRYFDRVYSYLRVLLRGRQDAEDLAQQVFMHAFEAISRYERRSQPFRVWLFVIVRNAAISHLRGSRELVLEAEELDRKLDRPRPGETGPSPSLLRWTSDRDFSLLVERLPLAQRQVLALRFLLDMTTTEAAAVLGRTPNGVRQIQHRALRTLERRLRSTHQDLRPDRRARMRRWPRRAAVLRSRRFALNR